MTWGQVAVAGIGLLAGSEGQESQSSTQRQLDPEQRSLLYDGEDSIFGRIRRMMDQNPTGINDQTIAGLNSRWNTATDPSIRAGFQNQRQTGNALMSLPIAGNPFTSQGGYSRDMFSNGAQPQAPTLLQRGSDGRPDLTRGGLLMNPPPQPQSNAPRIQPAAQQGPAPGYNPSQQAPSDIMGLYASIGRTGDKAPSQQEITYWRNTGLTGDQLAQRFKQEAASYGRGLGYDANIDQARGLLSAPAPQPAFRQPVTPARVAAPTPAPAPYNPQTPGSQFNSEEALAEWQRQQNLYNVG